MASRDQVVGAGLIAVSAVVIIVYGWLVFFSEWWELVLKLTGFIAVVGVFGILGWIGYTLATTPPPKPIEEIEKELEEELKKLEEEMKKEEEKEKAKEEKGKEEGKEGK
ncbi:MAG: transcriptional regulator [Thermoprotei archaeon]|nr:MAG: transcriptional regulator [Thermoprotei archaeon]